MGKGKKKTALGPSHKHLYSRISFLHQAALYLSSVTDDGQRNKIIPTNDNHTEKSESTAVTNTAAGLKSQVPRSSKEQDEANSTSSICKPTTRALSRLYASQSRIIARKATIRLTPDMKRSICKICDTMLLPGTTSSTSVENLSRRGRKPWADTLVIKCNACGAVKRFPVGAKRQRRKTERRKVFEPRSAIEGGRAAVTTV